MKIGDVILRENFAPTFFKPVPNALAREDDCECKKFRVVRLAAAVEVSTQHSQLPSLISSYICDFTAGRLGESLAGGGTHTRPHKNKVKLFESQ